MTEVEVKEGPRIVEMHPICADAVGRFIADAANAATLGDETGVREQLANARAQIGHNATLNARLGPPRGEFIEVNVVALEKYGGYLIEVARGQ